MVLFAIRHFVTVKVCGRIVLVGDALGVLVWDGQVLRQIKENKRDC